MSFPGELAFYFSNWGLSLLSHMLKLMKLAVLKMSYLKFKNLMLLNILSV